MVIRELGLEAAGSVRTPGTSAEHDVTSAPSAVLGWKVEEESKAMELQDATRSRGIIIARCSSLAQDRVDIQHACKEASRRMERLRCDD